MFAIIPKQSARSLCRSRLNLVPLSVLSRPCFPISIQWGCFFDPLIHPDSQISFLILKFSPKGRASTLGFAFDDHREALPQITCTVPVSTFDWPSESSLAWLSSTISYNNCLEYTRPTPTQSIRHWNLSLSQWTAPLLPRFLLSRTLMALMAITLLRKMKMRILMNKKESVLSSLVLEIGKPVSWKYFLWAYSTKFILLTKLNRIGALLLLVLQVRIAPSR